MVINNIGKDIEKIEVLNEELKHRDKSIGGYYFITDVKATYFNGIEEELRLYDTCEEVCKTLKKVCFKEEMFDSILRFCADAEYDNDDDGLDYWQGLYNKLNSNLNLTEQDIKDINLCVQICTVFKEFDYNTFIR